MIAVGSWMDTGLTHDWAGGDFLPSQMRRGGRAGVRDHRARHLCDRQHHAGRRPPPIAATIQIARLLGAEIGNAVIQTFVRVREQTYSNLIGLHVSERLGGDAVNASRRSLSAPFGGRPTGLGDPTDRKASALLGVAYPARSLCARLYRRVLADRLGLARRAAADPAAARPPPNPLTPPRLDL